MKNFKHPLEYIWDWTEDKGSWAKLLIHKIVTNKELTLEIRNEIYNLFLKEIGLSKDDVCPALKKPNFEAIFDNRNISLKYIDEVCGVNRLAENQRIDFAKNLTVIYGKNASGKTGYCRILKRMGHSYDKNTDIHSNVFSNDNDSLKAKICYEIDEKENIVSWNSETQCEDLAKVAVFNDSCVTLSLNNKRELVAIPEGFHYFNIAKSELNLLNQQLQTDITNMQTKPTCFSDIKSGTESFKLINSIDNSFTEEIFNKFLESYGDVDANIEALNKQLTEMNKPLIETKNKERKNRKDELISIYKNIWNISVSLSKTNFNKLLSILENVKTLKSKQNKSISEIAKNKGIEFYESKEFKDFLQSAEKYIVKLGHEDYPKEQNTCVYCRQTLDSDAARLISFYRELLKNELQNQINDESEKVQKTKKTISEVSISDEFYYSPFGMNVDEPIVPQYYKNLKGNIEELRNQFISSTETTKDDDYMQIDFEKPLLTICKTIISLIYEIHESKKALSTISKKYDHISQQLLDLEAVKLLNNHKKEIINYIINVKKTAILEQNKIVFNATSLSSKSTIARRDIIEKEFYSIFKDEKVFLGCPSFVNVSLGTSDSRPELRQSIVDEHSLEDILSEGEQKSIALAEFITELRISKQANPVVFDDPVNSLDHERKALVAKRIINLSSERQVIVFTHSILLFYAFEQELEKQFRKKLKIDYKYYSVDTDVDFTGYVYENVPPRKETYKTYKTKINTILNLTRDKRKKSEQELAVDGYNSLRSAIELLVEDLIFRKCIKRYKRNVALTNLELIDGVFIDENKHMLATIFEKASGFIDARSNPQEEAISPTLLELKKDFDFIETLYDQLKL